jgi:hypothetical protein
MRYKEWNVTSLKNPLMKAKLSLRIILKTKGCWFGLSRISWPKIQVALCKLAFAIALS